MTTTAPSPAPTALAGLFGSGSANPAMDRAAAVVRAPESLRPLLVAELANWAPLLVVTATERECQELAGLYDDEVAQSPSSSGSDTIGRRLQVLSSIMSGRAPRIVVAAARSVVQPISPGGGAPGAGPVADRRRVRSFGLVHGDDGVPLHARNYPESSERP